MTITKEFVLAVVAGLQALRAHADDMQKEPQFKAEDGVGRILRKRTEEARQGADLLAGWVRRSAPEAGLNPEDFDI